MPTYEYECTRCGEIIEEFKPMSAAPRQRCPSCRGKVERLISGGAGILFKGSGFYVTDSRGKKSGGGTPATEAGTGAAAGTGGQDKPKNADHKGAEPKR